MDLYLWIKKSNVLKDISQHEYKGGEYPMTILNQDVLFEERDVISEESKHENKFKLQYYCINR